MLLAHHRELVADLREPTPEDPWRVLVSGCLNGWQCGVDSTDNGLGASLSQLLCLPTFRAVPFCPEQHALGTPRTTPDIHRGDGFDVIAGRAMVLDERGDDVTDKMLSGARAMVQLAVAARAELAILTDMSAACGSQVISSGCRLAPLRHYQKGVGVASAMLLDALVASCQLVPFWMRALLNGGTLAGGREHVSNSDRGRLVGARLRVFERRASADTNTCPAARWRSPGQSGNLDPGRRRSPADLLAQRHDQRPGRFGAIVVSLRRSRR